MTLLLGIALAFLPTLLALLLRRRALLVFVVNAWILWPGNVSSTMVAWIALLLLVILVPRARRHSPGSTLESREQRQFVRTMTATLHRVDDVIVGQEHRITKEELR